MINLRYIKRREIFLQIKQLLSYIIIIIIIIEGLLSHIYLIWSITLHHWLQVVPFFISVFAR
jgi:hypothetical protein